MGKKSIKENKSIYQTTREALGMTREKASEAIGFMSPEKIERIENGKVNIMPEDIKFLAEGYKAPELRNYYCACECPLGIGKVAELHNKSLEQIAIETLNCIHRLEKEKDRLVEIADDGVVTPDEYEDFARIKDSLDKIAKTVSALQLWVDQKTVKGELKL